MPLTAAAVVGGVTALAKTGTGIAQTVQANRRAKRNIRPTFNIEDEYYDNRDIAARSASSGIGDAALSYYRDTAGAGLGSTLSAITQAGGGINAAQNTMNTYLQSLRDVAVKDSIMQQENIRYFIDRNADLAKQKVQQWVLNEYEPYKDRAAANATQAQAGMQNIFTGAGELTGALSSYAMGSNYEDLLKSQIGNNNVNNGTAPAPTANTTYYTNKPSSEYGDFVSEFDSPYTTPTIFDRATQVQQEIQKQQEAGEITPEMREMLLNLFNFQKR